MLTKVDATTDQGQTLTLLVHDPSSGYVIRDIEGLDPVRATLVSSSFASMDGEQYQSSRREKRHLIFKLDLKSQYTNMTATQLRSNLYNYFMPKSNVKLRFYVTDLGFVDISGRVESFEAPLFVQEPQATIAITCFNPDFYDPTSVILPGNTTSGVSAIVLNYEGTVETGFVFKLNLNRSLSEFTIVHTPGDFGVNTTTDLNFDAPMLAGDVITISTISGDKYARLTRAGVTSSIVYGVNPTANWINLEPGVNYIHVAAGGAAIPFTIEYTNKYGGL